MAQAGRETGAPARAGATPGPWADGLSVGVLLAGTGRLLWANARLAELLGEAGGAEALRGELLEALLEDAGEGLPGSSEDEGAAGPLHCRLRPRSGPPLEAWAAPLGAGAEPGSTWWELRPRSEAAGAEEAEAESARRRLREAERALARERARAEREVAEREELLTVVSHELRTPLTVIAGFNKLLLSERAGALTDLQRHFLEESARSCRRLGTFVGNLMGAAREASGAGAPELCDAALGETIEGVVRFLKPLLEERRLEVRLELAPGAERARFDPLRIEQMVTNLLANAVRYSPAEGRIVVRAWPLRERGRRLVEVAVDDAGPGIPEAERERVFRAYVRGSEPGSGSGLGLGLALCRRIVEAHGGAIRAAASPEGGARLAFTLPAADGGEG